MIRLRLSSPDETGIALVVFSGEADLNWLRVLKTGFRHCFIVLESSGCWVIYDPLSHRTDISVVEGDDVFGLIHLYRAQGMRVVPWVVRRPPIKSAPMGLYTCVEAAKRILGIHSRRIITPWNLYNFLKK